MKHYKHLTWNDRIYLERLLKQGYHKAEIAKIIGCSLATVYNEIKRGSYEHTNSDLTTSMRYDADCANRKYRQHLMQKGRTPKLLLDKELGNYIAYMIAVQHYSVEAIMYEIELNNISFDVSVKSANTIYAAIRQGYIKGITMADLPRRGKHKRKKEKVESVPAYWRERKGTSIDERPEEINERNDFGHWEMDCLCGKSVNHKTVLVLTERKTRYEIVEKLPTHTMDAVVKALNRIEKRMGGNFYKVFKSITVDNGMEFKDYIGMEKAIRRKGKRTTIYYCHVRSPSERGSNENNNILLRRCPGLEKGSDFDMTLTYNICKQAEEWINTYPRKLFGGLCSMELYQRELSALVSL